jgi:Flp pilus assembly protein TadD
MSQADPVAPAHPAGASPTATVESCYAAGLEALRQGDLGGAQEWAAQCDRLPGSQEDARRAALHGAIAAEVGDFEGAADHYRRALERSPGDAAIARQLAEALAAGGAVSEAVGILEAAVQREPNDASLLTDLGYLRMMNGDRRGAREAIEHAAGLQPGESAIGQSLAQIYEALGEPARAVEILSRVAREAPSPRVLNELGRLYLQLEQYNEAEAVFRSLRTLDPSHDLLAEHGQAWCRIKKGDWRGALDVALSAARLDRYDLTTAFLSYAKDRLFGRVPDAAAREADLGERLRLEMRDHAEYHSVDRAMDESGTEEGGDGG